MKNQLFLTLFLISLIYCSALKTKSQSQTANLKSSLKEKANQNESELTTQLFSTPAAKCASAEDLARDAQEVLLQSKSSEDKSFNKAMSADLWWVKNWGYGESAYLVDFMSPLFKDLFISEAKALYDNAKIIDNKISGNYVDPFDYENFITDEMSAEQKAKLKANYKLINENYVQDVYDISINTVQLHTLMKNWNWVSSTTADYSKDFLMKYDADGDGRLNIREFVLGAIDYNKKYYGNPKVKKVFLSTATKLIAMFTFFDCNDDGYINAEEIWKKIRDLNRGTGETRYNIFGLNEGLRVKAVNDFILKCHSTRNGLLSKEEFVSCVLLSFWNRQCEKKKILTDDSRSLINLRWSGEGQKDKAFLKNISGTS